MPPTLQRARNCTALAVTGPHMPLSKTLLKLLLVNCGPLLSLLRQKLYTEAPAEATHSHSNKKVLMQHDCNLYECSLCPLKLGSYLGYTGVFCTPVSSVYTSTPQHSLSLSL